MPILVSVMAFMLFFLGCTKENSRIVGKWQGANLLNQRILIDFGSDNHAVFAADTQVLGGPNCIISGRKIELIYQVNFSREPYTFDITQVYDGIKSDQPLMKGIFKLISDTKMELRLRLGDGDRFTKFDTADKLNSIFLEKVNS